MSFYRGLTCENVPQRRQGNADHPYVAKPEAGPFPGVVLIHHLPVERVLIETTAARPSRYMAICAPLYADRAAAATPIRHVAQVPPTAASDAQMLATPARCSGWREPISTQGRPVRPARRPARFIYACQKGRRCVVGCGAQGGDGQGGLNANACADRHKDLAAPCSACSATRPAQPESHQTSRAQKLARTTIFMLRRAGTVLYWHGAYRPSRRCRLSSFASRPSIWLISGPTCASS